jgi:pimeloyl-ACP methyl ester carboxylesterase
MNRTIQADGVNIFYREAGAPDAPAILLMHGFPTSSHMFRNLIPLLATKYRVIAPDLPGFGFTEVPAARNYQYTFDNLANTMEAFLQAIKLDKFALYVFDYGAPVGLRLAAAKPERITALISQNGNAYLEGLSDGWTPMRKHWADPNEENTKVMRGFLTPEATKWQYTHGVPDPASVAPESYTLDSALMARPGNIDIQLELFYDYRKNLELYPVFQAFFRKAQMPTLAIWGKNDPFFTPPGAEAYRRDNPNATVQLLDTGHFALETHVEVIGKAIHALLD